MTKTKTMDEEPEGNYPPHVIAALMRGTAVQVRRSIPWSGPDLPEEVADVAVQVLAELTVDEHGVGEWLWGPRTIRTCYSVWLVVGIYEPDPDFAVPPDLSSLSPVGKSHNRSNGL